MTGSIRVVSKRKGGIPPKSGEIVIAGDRSNPILGNPYILKDHDDMKERLNVIQKYSEDLDKDFEKRGPKFKYCQNIAEMIRNGENIALCCWCAPLPCHLDLVKNKIEELTN